MLSIVFLCPLFGPLTEGTAQDSPLTAQRLIEESQSLFESLPEESKENCIGCSDLANAQAYRGDFDGAMKTIGSPRNDIEYYTTLVSCLRIVAEHTGGVPKVPPLPEDASEVEKSLHVTAKIELAQALAGTGRLNEALSRLPREESDPWVAAGLVGFYLFLSDHQLRKGDRNGADASLRRAMTLLERWPEGPTKIDRLEEVVRLAVRLEQKGLAESARTTAANLMAKLSANQRPNISLAIAWGRLAKCYAILEAKTECSRAFSEASRIAIASHQATPGDSGLVIASLGRIGAWQDAAGQKDDGALTSRKAVMMADADDPLRDYSLSTLAAIQCEEGVDDLAAKTQEAMSSPYWKALTMCKRAHALQRSLDQGKPAELLKQAEALADAERDPHFSTDMFGKTAEVLAGRGDLVGARRCIHKVGKADVEGKYRQRIAFYQIGAGFPDDAYRTIKTIEEAKYRMLPMAKLARFVAKTESSAKSKAANP